MEPQNGVIGASRVAPAALYVKRVIACAVSMIMAIAFARLMHNQRDRAVNHAELLRRLSEKPELSKFLHGRWRPTPNKSLAGGWAAVIWLLGPSRAGA